VNTSQTVARLEALLSRVRKHAAEPRPARAAAIRADAAPAAAPTPAVAPAPPPPPPPPMPPQRTEADIVLEVEVAEATQDTIVAVATDDVVAPAALDSRERLVAAEPLAAEAPAVESSPTEVRARDAEPVPEPEVAQAELSDEEIEEAPASSRRPVGPQPEERLAEMAFGAEEPSPPRHTPPPESGRLPAAPSEPEFDVDTTGVREAAKPVARAPQPQPEPQLAPGLAAVAVRGEVAASSAVVNVVGHAERAMPSRFVELLDASLAL